MKAVTQLPTNTSSEDIRLGLHELGHDVTIVSQTTDKCLTLSPRGTTVFAKRFIGVPMNTSQISLHIFKWKGKPPRLIFLFPPLFSAFPGLPQV